MSVTDKTVELNDVFDGTIATAQICGGCWFANAPGPPPAGGYQNPDPVHPLTITIDCGDGHTNTTNILSNNLNPIAAIGFGPGGTIHGMHKYSNVVDPRNGYTVTMKAYCVNAGQSSMWDTLDNLCTGMAGYCTAHPATVGVYAPIAPSLTAITNQVQHGKLNPGTLSVVRSARE
jgi:hypothetical protein